MMLKSFKSRVEKVSKLTFEKHALELFHFQVKNNPVYKAYLNSIEIDTDQIDSTFMIPFLPISTFKYQTVKTGNWLESKIYESSGTTNDTQSKHYIEDEELYNYISEMIFKKFYGNPKDYEILALLPSYLERSNSSLVHMIQNLIYKSGSENSGFYLDDYDLLYRKIKDILNRSDRKIILWGVTFGLLDFAEKYDMDLKNVIIIETGGMKGRREELTRPEIHNILRTRFNVAKIHSEYGMTELLSQAYSKGDGIFKVPPWMRVYIREIYDPFSINNQLNQGVINIIDLANVHSCAFIATDDLGRIHPDGSFEVLGRLDNSDLRGCNLLLN